MAKKVTVKSKHASKAPQSHGRLVSKAPRNSGKTASAISVAKNTINLKKVGVELQAQSNTQLGHQALEDNTTGSENTAVGFQALRLNTIGDRNSCLGAEALSSNTRGDENTAIGAFALDRNKTGETNTAVGMSALSGIFTGSGNTAIGVNAGRSVEAENSTFIGSDTGAFSFDVSNSTALGSGTDVNDDNQVRIGNIFVTSIGGPVNFTAFSDSRYKKNVSADVPGLAFIAKLRPITYTLDVEGLDKKLKAMRPQLPAPATPLARAGSTRSLDGEVRAGSLDSIQLPFEELKVREETVEELKAKQDKARIVYTGFVAQEVEQAAKELNYQFSGVDGPKNTDHFYGLRYAEFVVPLVKAVQELNEENKQVKKELGDLRNLVNKLMKGMR